MERRRLIGLPKAQAKSHRPKHIKHPKKRTLLYVLWEYVGGMMSGILKCPTSVIHCGLMIFHQYENIEITFH